MKQYTKIFFACSLISFFLVSCTEDTMDSINRDKDNPQDVEARYMIPQLLTSSAFSVTGGDFSTYASVYMEHEGGTHNQMYYAEKRQGEPISTSTYNNPWGSTYSNVMQAKMIIEKCTNGKDKGNDIILAIAKVMLAYNAAVITDLFGDTPFSEAGVLDENMIPVYRNPKVDKQEEIYNNIFTLLDEAAAIFSSSESSDLVSIGTNDYYYSGNKALWLKAVNGLRARYTMRLLGRSANTTADLNNILSYIDNSFASSSEEMKLDIYNGSSQNNPLYSFSISRQALGASASFVEKLKARNDPRLTQMFMSPPVSPSRDRIAITDPSKIVVFNNGVSTESQTAYSWMITDYSPTAPTLLLSYHELLYLKAEAYARLGDTRAEEALKDAVRAGFANLERSLNSAISGGQVVGASVDLSGTVSDTYFDTEVKPLYTVNPVKEVMVQKYLAFAGASGTSVEAYNDYRRMQGMNENFIDLKNPLNDDEFPFRFIYGGDDVSSNSNIKGLIGDGTYVYKEKVWWAGGTK